MKYIREFCTHRLILFLFALCFISGIGMLVTWGSGNPGGIAVGVVIFIIVEYITHRYLLHEFPKLFPSAYRGHLAHHERPNDDNYLFGPIRYDLTGYLVYFVIGRLATGSISMAFAMIFGSSLGQIFYQWKHFVSHRPIKPLTPLGKWLKKKHLLHHHLDEHAWYGVSNPLMDIVMGTNRRVRELPAKQFPLNGNPPDL